MNAVEAQQLCQAAERALRHGSIDLAEFPKLLRRIIDERLWLARQVAGEGNVELKSLRELVTEKPLRGWGQDPAKIEAVIRDDAEVLALWREEMKEQGKRNDIVSNINEVERSAGTTRSYTLSRLKREEPQLFERVKNGELTANAAAIEAGFRHKTWTAPADVELLCAAIERRYPGWKMVKA